MAKFAYVARDSKGERIEGALEVEDRQAVIVRLQAMGYFPVRIQEVAGKSRGSAAFSIFAKRIRPLEISRFFRQMSDLVSAGVPLVKALDIIFNQARESAMREVIGELSKAVQGGDTFAQSLRRYPKIFPPLFIAMIRAGETGGMLPDVLKRIADFSEGEEDLKGKVLSALAYPAVMVVAGSVVVTILLTVVIPKITRVFEDMGQALPPITQVLIGITDFLDKTKWILLALVILGIPMLRRFAKSTEGHLVWDRFVLRIPVLGDVVHKRELSRFARTLGNLLRNGVQILSALDITRDVMTNIIIRREVEKLPDSISQGSTMANTLGNSALFPSFMVSMIAIGEETGQLDSVLLRTAETYEQQVDRSLRTLTSILEPIIILLLGLVVGFIVIAMLLPILTLDPMQGGME